MDEILVASKRRALEVLVALFLDVQLSNCHYTAILRAYRFGALKCLIDKNGDFVFFYDYLVEARDFSLEHANKCFYEKLIALSFDYDYPLLKPVNSPLDEDAYTDAGSELCDLNGQFRIYWHTLYGFRVKKTVICDAMGNLKPTIDWHILMCRRILTLYVEGCQDICSTILCYIGECSFMRYCKYLAHPRNSSVPALLLQRTLANELLSYDAFPWGLHFVDLSNYLEMTKAPLPQEFLYVLYCMWFERSIQPTDKDRFIDEYKEEEKTHHWLTFTTSTTRD